MKGDTWDTQRGFLHPGSAGAVHPQPSSFSILWIRLRPPAHVGFDEVVLEPGRRAFFLWKPLNGRFHLPSWLSNTEQNHRRLSLRSLTRNWERGRNFLMTRGSGARRRRFCYCRVGAGFTFDSSDGRRGLLTARLKAGIVRRGDEGPT